AGFTAVIPHQRDVSVKQALRLERPSPFRLRHAPVIEHGGAPPRLVAAERSEECEILLERGAGLAHSPHLAIRAAEEAQNVHVVHRRMERRLAQCALSALGASEGLL